MLKKILIGFFSLIIITVLSVYFVYSTVKQSLPEVIKIGDYKPLLVSQIYDRNNKKIGEFFRERRILVPYADIPKNVINAFLAAEDDQFFEHKGINYQGLLRAAIVNMRAGHKVQGGSTITQQVAKTLFLTSERSYTRKLKDILLALQIEKNLSKEEILYLYLNQIYFGESAYGIEMAAQTYFKKSVKQLTLAEGAMLAALPKAPSEFSPVKNPSRAKERQIYVLNRMANVNYITKAEAEVAINEPIKVYLKEDYETAAAFYLETVRQLLVKQLGEEVILDLGVKIYTGLDIDMQRAAKESVVAGLKEVDKRQGYRGPLQNLDSDSDIEDYLEKAKKKLINESNPERTILADGQFAEIEWLVKKPNKRTLKQMPTVPEKLPSFLKINSSYEAVVIQVNDELGFVEVQLPEVKAYINFQTMSWAREPNFDKKSEEALITAPSQALKKGDVILVRIVSENVQWPKLEEEVDTKLKTKAQKKLIKIKTQPDYPDAKLHLQAELDQEPTVEASLLSIDQQTQDVLAMVGGYSFARNEFNRALQAARQTGSAFKALVFAAALDKGYNPSTAIIDAPIAYKQGNDEGQDEDKIWKPSNHEKNFSGEVTMRNALVKSLNIPSVKIIEDIGVGYASEFARRLGVFSKLNPDFTLVLGSSSLTLYEMTKVFSQFGRMGLRTRPNIIKKVIDRKVKVLLEKLDLDVRFNDEIKRLDEEFDTKRTAFLESQANNSTISVEPVSHDTSESQYYFENPEQLIKPEVAYVITDMLKNVVTDAYGTGARAASLGREVAAKTGTTSGYFDAWFVGYTPNIATGVWVGFDKERTIGKSEVGGKAALPIWLSYMKVAHQNLPMMSFIMPEKVKIVKIDADTGKLSNSVSQRVVSQAYIEGTEPTTAESRSEETTDHLKQDMDE
ncbi:MAG: PBP1A family penicillin-binding protein [Bdellovibrionota bacterium]